VCLARLGLGAAAFLCAGVDATLRAMVRPSYDEATLAEYFRGIDAALFDHPVAGPVIRVLAVTDPDVLSAVADVDRSQIRDAAHRTPLERLHVAAARWNALARLRGHG